LPVNTIIRFGDHIREFMKLESSAGLVLIGATILAMLVKNSPLDWFYTEFLRLEGGVWIGALRVEKPLFLWVNDGYMAVFFFMIGMEIKHEMLHGHLSDRSQLVLPAIAAVGGILLPAALFFLVNQDNPASIRGWAIPTATDIAFALGVLAILGTRAPVALKVFLMTLAILDDVGAIIIIALFYTSNLAVGSLVLAGICVVGLIVLNRLGVMRPAAYIIVGLAMWVCVLKSGVHATLAGVITALMIPAKKRRPDDEPPLEHLIEVLHPWVAFGILPLFAFVNAGIDFGGLRFADLMSGVPFGIILGLFVGKQLGIFGLSWMVIKLGIARLPAGVNWAQLYGVSLLCGIGFTMSLFIAGLAYEEYGEGYGAADRLAILAGSGVAGLCGYLVLRAAGTKEEEDESAVNTS